MKRRQFLKASIVAYPAIISSKNKSTNKPISIATWAPNTGAVNAAMATMKSGGTSLDAVEAGAKVPEADINDMSVGYGGRPDRDGHVTLDACIMDWEMNAGSVTYLEGIKHAISVARAVMEKTPHVMLSGDGALKFAIEQGFEQIDMLTPQAKKEYEEWLKTAEYKPKANIELHDTIGIMAIDAKNNLSGACTTSGMAYKMRGRVGDSPILGAGMYVDNEVGGAVATGVGELVMKTCGSFLITELMRQGLSPQKACEQGVKRIAKKLKDFEKYQVGFLAIDKSGNYGAFSILPGFNYAVNIDGKTEVKQSASLI